MSIDPEMESWLRQTEELRAKLLAAREAALKRVAEIDVLLGKLPKLDDGRSLADLILDVLKTAPGSKSADILRAVRQIKYSVKKLSFESALARLKARGTVRSEGVKRHLRHYAVEPSALPHATIPP